jgi:hypothetical protein
MFFAPGQPTKQVRRPDNETKPYMIPPVLRAIFYESRVDNSGDHYEVMSNPVKGGVTVYIFNKNVLIGQFEVSQCLLVAGPKPLIEHLCAEALTERSLGAGWHGIDCPVVWG